MKLKKIATEFQECKAFVQWADYQPSIGQYLFHIPNEGERNEWERKKQHDQGLRSGIPDYMLAIPASGYHGLFLEMKRSGTQNHKRRDSQTEWIRKLNERGYRAVFVHGAEEAITEVKNYLNDQGKIGEVVLDVGSGYTPVAKYLPGSHKIISLDKFFTGSSSEKLCLWAMLESFQ